MNNLIRVATTLLNNNGRSKRTLGMFGKKRKNNNRMLWSLLSIAGAAVATAGMRRGRGNQLMHSAGNMMNKMTQSNRSNQAVFTEFAKELAPESKELLKDDEEEMLLPETD